MAMVLVVDDNEMLRGMVAMQLTMLEHGVLEASDGESALEMARKQPVELVLTDVNMPGIDGFEVMDRMKQLRPGLPVILLSGEVSDADLERQAEDGSKPHWLKKPFGMAELAEAVGKALSEAPAK